MSYNNLTYYSLKCDGDLCTNVLKSFYTDKSAVDSNCLNYGWIKTGEGKHLCPQCVFSAVTKVKNKVGAL